MMRRTIPMLILAATGVLLIVANFSPFTVGWQETVLDWFNILAAFAFVLGAGNLLAVNLEQISSRRPGWAYSVITIVAFAVTLVVGLVKVGAVPNQMHPDIHLAGAHDVPQAAFGWIYEYMLVPLTATMFALLAFYVASAAFRAFRAKNLEASLLLGTAFVILLGRTFAGVVLTGWLPEWASGLRLENLSVYVMQVFNTAGNRAIIIGIALGVAATSLRILLGIDRSWRGSSE